MLTQVASVIKSIQTFTTSGTIGGTAQTIAAVNTAKTIIIPVTGAQSMASITLTNATTVTVTTSSGTFSAQYNVVEFQ